MSIVRFIIFFSISIFLIGCNFNESTKAIAVSKDPPDKKDQKKTAFNSIEELFHDTTSSKWTDGGSFWLLYFEKEKIVFDFNPSCGYYFPTRLENNKLFFYWAKTMNCDFNRGLNASFNGVVSPSEGDKFGEVRLVNDTTIIINYFFNDWIKKVNEAEKETIDTLFPSFFKQIIL